jgi:hypothetical protein
MDKTVMGVPLLLFTMDVRLIPIPVDSVIPDLWMSRYSTFHVIPQMDVPLDDASWMSRLNSAWMSRLNSGCPV